MNELGLALFEGYTLANSFTELEKNQVRPYLEALWRSAPKVTT